MQGLAPVGKALLQEDSRAARFRRFAETPRARRPPVPTGDMRSPRTVGAGGNVSPHFVVGLPPEKPFVATPWIVTASGDVLAAM